MSNDTRRDPRYDILFEPVAIGPVTAKNRFYQVPHCNGMGYRDPTALAWMRGVKAEGGWAVVCTEQVEFHHTSDITPFIELRLWDDRDIPMLARMADRIHEFGALAGLELAYNGMNAPNFYGREVPMGPSALPVMTFTYDPVQARAMTKRDIRDLRRWHRAAALRARRAGFDLVYVYAGHALTHLHHFLSRRYNHRTDEYGGSPREPRSPAQGDAHRHPRGGGSHLCGAVPDIHGRVPGSGRTGEIRGGRRDRTPRRASRPVGPGAGRLGERFRHLALRARGRARALHRGREEADHEAGGRGRAVHLSRPDGFGGPKGPGRSHRQRAPVDRRPVPPEEDRGGASGGHSRVHRLQHLRLRRLHDVAHPMHPEPDDGRGVAQGLAPRAHPRQGVGQARPRRRRRSRGAGGGAGARQARIRRDACGEGHRARGAGEPGEPSPGALRLGAGAGLPRAAASPASERGDLLRTRSWTRRRCWSSASRAWWSPLARTGGGTGSAMSGPGPCP